MPMIRLLAIPLMALCLVGCHPHYTIVEHSDITLPCGDQPKLIVEMVNGSIKITTAKCKEITGQLTKRGVGLDKEEAEQELKNMVFDSKVIEDKIVIQAKRSNGGKSWNNSGTEATLQIPVGSQVELITSNGSIQMNGRNQGVIAKSSNGSVTLTGGFAPIDVHTSNGAVRCSDVAGVAYIETTNGSIKLKGKGLQLDCKSTNGSIECTGDLSDGQHKLITSNSHITVTLPKDSSLQLDANTSNGKISSDFSINKNESNKKSTVIKGTIGGGNPARTLLLKSSNSSISIKRGKDTKSTTDSDTE